MPTCFICKEILKTIKLLYIHFEYKHQSQLEFYECVESDCHKRKFDTFESLKRYLNLHHYSQESQKSITQNKNIDCDNINLLNTFESHNDNNIIQIVNSDLLQATILSRDKHPDMQYNAMDNIAFFLRSFHVIMVFLVITFKIYIKIFKSFFLMTVLDKLKSASILFQV